MDKDTIMFLIAIIGCGIGIAGFVIGMTSRAKKDGELLAKIGFCVDGIAEIKKDVQGMRDTNVDILKETAIQDNRIDTLERETKDIKKEMEEMKRRLYSGGQGDRRQPT